jgi:transcriptional regulator with GAF, ATPase, and Fis domain
VGIEIPTDEKLRETFENLGFVSRCLAMMPILQHAYRAACVSDITVLLEGETGTGKQVLARAIQALDRKRCGFPFVTVHCSTLTETLAESELFGHQRGAFSGALTDRPGLFTAANRGTIFLDDVNDLPLSLQPKLLDVLQRRTLRAVGSDREASTDVRIIAAANRPLAPLVRAGTFRSDLYHRLNVIRLCLPPLRERTEDLSPLILEFARRHAGLYGSIESLDPALVGHLRTFPFEGNIRELENAVQRMLFAKREGHVLTRADWLMQDGHSDEPDPNDHVREAGNMLWQVLAKEQIPFAALMQRVESNLLQRALETEGHTRRELARLLQTSERTLYHKLRSYGLTAS